MRGDKKCNERETFFRISTVLNAELLHGCIAKLLRIAVAILLTNDYSQEKKNLHGHCRPAPTAQWVDNRGVVISGKSPHYKIETSENQSVLIISRVHADNKGNYALRVKNRSGEDRCDIPIQVRIR
ncbi:unnamed protein product [Anisakis simplex]|uniref:I-set domain-containing protein n=1 Tax=Anisakis simplex TaxID=6269 RepID=A0A0M3K071_ANISI|nr:unnamed protein product [Anisakis simplex]